MVDLAVPLSETQKAFTSSHALYRAFVGGRGAGKTWVGAYDLLKRVSGPDARGRLFLVVSPTYTLLSDTSFRTVRALGVKFGIIDPTDVRKAPPSITTNGGAEIIFRSADEPERLRGPNLSGAWLDEASQMTREVFDITIACLREWSQKGWLSATFTPKGKSHWTFERFGTATPDVALFHARTKDNPFNPPDFQDTLARQYTTHLQRQELLGEFTDPPGAMFRREWFPIAEVSPADARRVRAWDTAATAGDGDWTAGVLMARSPGGMFFVEDVVRGQWSAGERNAVIRQTAQLDAQRHGNAVHIWLEQEPGSSGKESAETLIGQLAGFPVFAEPSTGSKTVRAEPLAAQAEAGNVRLVRGPWNAAFLDEMSSFPDGAHDDQCDAAAHALAKLALGTITFGPSSDPPPEARSLVADHLDDVFGH